MRKKMYKVFLTLMVSLSLCAGSAAQNEIRKMLETFTETVQIQAGDEDEEEIMKEEDRDCMSG